ncbi:uroplakin-1a [Paramormyrops kingsleyae]|uniref:Tetraspanin n=1 Tax=Paramormyrops kingsleyae TaxID=1676925 RepID=A0A3B3S7H4_9TELE|nr:uroplakin-1a [Paramormyrops kingsleyae]
MEDGKSTRVLKIILIIGNAFTAILGLALFAVAIWVTVDSYGLYPLAGVTGKDDIFAGSWIAIFTGFSFFCVAVFGIFAVIWKHRSLMMTYLALMLIIYIFECASVITAATHRDYLVGNSNLVKKQMLRYYADNSDDGKQITDTWNRVMQEVQCCGTDGPIDWITYTSTFKQNFPNVFPWPLNCCRRQNNYEIADQRSCKVGYVGSMFAKGCFGYIESVFSNYTWAISWYGFSVLIFVFFLLLCAMVYYLKL